jgi:hypothetical protein
MCKVAAFLGIDFDPCLQKPTVLGRLTAGNAFDGVAAFDINPRIVERWRERIPGQNAEVIEFHLADEMTALDYTPKPGARGGRIQQVAGLRPLLWGLLCIAGHIMTAAFPSVRCAN